MTGLGDFFKTELKTGNCFCVAKENIVAEKLAHHININLKNREINRVIRFGSLVEVTSTKLDGERVAVRLVDTGYSVEGPEDLWVCFKLHLLPVDPVMLSALIAVFEPSLRVALVQNEHIFRELAAIEVGKKVMLVSETQDSRLEPELAVVRYKGPVPEMGPGTYYGLEILVHSTQGQNDGSAFGRRFFQCPPSAGVFVALNRLGPYRNPKALNLGSCVTSGGEVSSETTAIPSSSSMPSNERRVHQNGANRDVGNFKSTLVLHLKEKESIPRNSQSIKLEKTEKLIDVDVTGENGDTGNVSLKVGDRVVWILDTRPEQGVVRWLGHLDGRTLKSDLMAGVEFEKPIGDCSGVYKKQQLFQTKKNHGKFIPLMSLVKAEDFFGSPPADLGKKKAKNMKLIENCSSSKPSNRNNLPTRSRKSDALLKTQRSESFLWSNHLVELANSATNNSQSREDLTFKDGDDSVCKSEYVFSETNIDHSQVTSKIDNANKHTNKDFKNNNSVKRTAYNLSNYPIGEANPRDYFLSENIPGSRRTCEDRMTKPTEGKIRHSYSQDLQSHHSPDDFLSELWPAVSENNQCKSRIKEDKKTKTFPGKADRLSNSTDLHVEAISEGIQNLLAVPGQEIEDPLLTVSPTGNSDYFETPDSPESQQPHDLGVGSVVEVTVSGGPRYGVIRWIGIVPEDKKARKVAGIEMEEEHLGCTDGTFNGRRYFQCTPRKALFVSLSMCKKDSRFQDVQPVLNDTKIKTFGQVQSPVIPGAVRPISRKGNLETLCGKYRGIQGHHNSCYLDATLFSMFTFTSVFDSLLFRPQTENDVPQYQEVQRVLREEIVNPLRQNLYVRADRVMKLRTLLENLSSVTGLTSEEKDPEEFLTSLIAQILRAEPFLKLSSGQEAYHYQLFVEKDEHLLLPSVQQLFEQSFLASDIKLKEVPACLIIQMPRFGKSFKMYPRILPSQLLDVTDIIEDSPRQCTVCGKLAEFECKDCFGEFGVGLESIAFCAKCLETAHSHQRRSSHGWRPVSVPIDFSVLQDHCPVPRLYMELFAVVCIETSHYVAFVKCGSGSDAPWCFFDSMADRKGEQNGYNIPEMVSCPNLPYWLSDEGARLLQEMKDERQLPEHAKRLLCDAYMCMYQSPDVMMYR